MAKQTQLTISDLAVIMKFICSALAEPGSRLTTADIYVQTKDSVTSALESHYFRTSLSERIKDGTLAGVIIKKGRYGGVSIEDLAMARDTAESLAEKAENTPEVVPLSGGWMPTDDEPEKVHAGAAARAEQKANALIVQIGKNLRVYPLDKYNWAVQKLSGTNAVGEENWTSQSYFSTLDEALRGVARSMLDKRLRGGAETIKELKELGRVVNQAEANILNEIKTLVVNTVDKS